MAHPGRLRGAERVGLAEPAGPCSPPRRARLRRRPRRRLFLPASAIVTASPAIVGVAPAPSGASTGTAKVPAVKALKKKKAPPVPTKINF
ncbi:MAG: hypothetical protein U0359_31605 [Byssovorax sp.]